MQVDLGIFEGGLMNSTPGPVIFDLDGTLLDTAPDLAAALNALLEEEGCQRLPLTSVRTMVGKGAISMIKQGFARAGIQVEKELPEGMRSRFLDHYRACYMDRTKPFPGVVEALIQLKEMGHPLSVCTNKSHEMSVAILEGLALKHFFVGIVGGDSLATAKPDPAPIRAAIELSGSGVASATMVGDSITDIHAAHAAGIPAIAVTFGYTEIAPHDLGADAVIDHFDELIPALRRMSSNNSLPPKG